MRTRRSLVVSAAATALLGTVVVTAPAAHAAPVLPEDFALIDTPTGQQAGELTDAAFLPDGSVLSTGRLGTVHLTPQGGQPTQIASLPVFTSGSLGLTGIAVAPDFTTSRTVYTTRAMSTGTSTQVFRLSKWQADGTGAPTGLGQETPLLELPVNADNKGIQDVVVEPSGDTLWVAVGDNATVQPAGGATKDNVDKFALRALDPAQPTGKVLRIDTNGHGLSTNPYYEAGSSSSWRSRNYVSGLRDPRITLDPRGGVVVTDTGWAARHEVNLAFAGQNLKWPCWEGTTRAPGYRDLPECANVANAGPLAESVHGTADTLVGGVAYTGTSYPAMYRGIHFVANKGAHSLSTLAFDSSGRATQQITALATDIGDPVAVLTAPNGDIVVADAASAKMRRLSYKPANKAPVAAFNATVAPATKTVSFDASGSHDPDLEPLGYQWAFGDGTTGSGRTTEHTYSATEPVTVTLTVSDSHGAVANYSQTFLPGEAGPTVSLTTPGDATVFSAGESVHLAASANDDTDGPLTVAWRADRLHCPRSSTCEVNSLRTGTGPTFSFLFPSETDTQVVVTATAVNGRNVAAGKRYVVNPRTARFSVAGSRSARIKIGAHEDTNRLVTVGSPVQVSAPATSLDRANFTKWADNQSTDPTRQIIMPASGLALRADYQTPIQKRYADEAPLRTLVGTPVGLELIEGDGHWQLYTSGRLYWTEQYGVKTVAGEILTKYVTLGAHAFLGSPKTDELVARANNGRYNDFVGGPLTGDASIYWTSSIGAMAIHGEIRAKWQATNGEAGPLGFPTTDQLTTPDGIGRVNHFNNNNASIYWTAATGAHYVMGRIWQKWRSLGWEKFFGYPTTDEVATPDNVGRYTHFSGNGSIYWSPSTDAFEVHGTIRDRFAATGWQTGVGYPITDETWTPGSKGKYNHFRQGSFDHSIYWRAGTNVAWEVKGMIRLRWRDLGWETSYLGFPTSGEYNIPTGKRSDFQYGYITYNGSTGAIEDRRY
ncbi:peptidoglycan biosynthesis protein [Amycolatopsis sp. WAC 04169]|uniref:PQQ-dependent sugar dehydrogenase n=1 Tax=Amycolatopsis sp. WAC 04169 TaxID=2203197 RepID=UPI000F78EB37|nr:PQQ-dependent sugar dehydrogenase [Amycolatopsis sp. WAC 04169]RSN19675.1 peptidoglycan biosynthesis protein [Amycolatopsis sp. WAC 04169]